MEINIYQQAIQELILDGYTILQIIQPNGNNLYFNVYKWQEGYFNTAQSIDFNTVEGINITDFLIKNANICNNRVDFINRFNNEINNCAIIRCEFSKTTEWYKWSAPTVVKNLNR